MSCTWEIHFELPPSKEWQELVHQVQCLKDELTPLRMDFFDDKPKMSVMVGDIDAFNQVLITMASEEFNAVAITVQLDLPFWNRKIQATLNDKDNGENGSRWKELER